jgi:transcription elongation factor B subunit 1
MSLEEDDVPNPLANLVKLISAEGAEFILSRDAAMASGTIRAMLQGPGQWKETSGPMPTIHFETISTPVLETVCQYFLYKQRYDHTPPPLPPFKLETEAIVKLLLAANFLDA